MTKAQSKYFNTAVRMDEALWALLEKKDFEYITVKEICEKAGVNRSTFYLHYETIGDLLAEAISYKNQQLMTRYEMSMADFQRSIENAPLEQLFLITPKYLLPYLSYIKEHKTIFKVTLSKPQLLQADKTYKDFFSNIFSPISQRYNIPQKEREYMLSFYIEGLMGIIKHWLKSDCKDSEEDIAKIMMTVIRR